MTQTFEEWSKENRLMANAITQGRYDLLRDYMVARIMVGTLESVKLN